MKTNQLNSTVGLLALFGILVFGNIVASRIPVKVDITEEKLYTLSEGSENIVSKLDAPMDIKLFFSNSLENIPPLLKTYHQRVRAMLEELQQHSEFINLEFIDPEPDSDEELLAQRYGIQGQPISAAGSFYFGIVFSNYAGEESLPYLDFQKEDTLEYDIVRRIYLLSLEGKPNIGVLSSIKVLGTPAPPPQFGMPQQPQGQEPAWLFTQELKQSYELTEIDPTGDDLGGEFDLLLVIHPKDLSEKMEYAIDQFVMSGKRAIFYMDPFFMRDQQNQNRFQPPANNQSLYKVFGKWGVEYDSGKVVVDPHYAYVQRTGMGSSTKVPVVLNLGPDSMQDDVATKKLNQLMMLYCGSVGQKDGVENVNFTPLITTSEASGVEDKFKLMYTQPEQLLADLKGGTPQNLAGLYSGKFRSAFDKAPEGVEGEHLQEVSEENHIVVVADVDMLEDQYWSRNMNFLGQNLAQAINQNTVLLNNLVEKMTGNNDLISLRSRSRFLRPFDKVLALEEKARMEYQTREKELQTELQKVEGEINKLMQKADPGQRVIVSADVQNQIKTFQDKKVKVAKELRKVRKNLRSSIDELGIFLQALNILLVPFLIALYGIFVITQKSRRVAS
jgi:ABC-type uncharacterized transport system involved in gliding motility auxiliary subunit